MRQLIAALVAITAGASDFAVADQFDDWGTQCDPACQTFTLEEVYKWEDGEPFLVLLEVDADQRLEISALLSRQEYEKYYTLNPPTEFRRGGREYVGARQFFGGSPATISVDGEEVQTVRNKDGGHVAGELKTETLEAFRGGREATVSGNFCAAPGCSKQSITFSLMGFSAAYNARTSGHDESNTASNSPENPVDAVADALTGNRYGIGVEHLRTKGNPYGDGAFVYVPKVKIAEYDRYFVWFVKTGQPVALNGPAISVTNNAKRPRDMGYVFWEGTGISGEDATRRGLDTVYGDR